MKEKVFYSKEVKHYEGLGIRDGASCIVKLTNYELQLCDIKNRPILKISLKDISNVAIISDKEIIEKDKSVIGRGVVGSVLFGGAGLILGGLSGLNKKQVVQNVDYLIINYKEDGEDKVVNVYANEGVLDKSFMKGLNYAVDISKQELKCPSCGNIYNFNDFKCSNCGQVLKDVKNVKKVFGLIFGCVIGFIILMGIIVIAVGSGSSSRDVNIIKRVANIENEQAEKIDNILNDIGLKDIEDMKADSDGLDGFEGEGSKGYRIKADFSDNIILYLDSDNNVICIRYADEDYYRNGNVLKRFE